MGEAWLKRHPEHTLDPTLRLRDLGVSAFRGLNLDKSKGDLGKFVQLARDGKVERGSVLLLENLDRFSRQPTSKAYRIFCELVEAGVVVQTLSPEQTIDESNYNDMMSVLPTIVIMQLAYEESRKKSGRVLKRFEEKRRQAVENRTPLSRRCPSWLEWDGMKGSDWKPTAGDKGKWKPKQGAKRTLNYIFRRTIEGIGQRRLTAELNRKFKPFKGDRWYGSMVAMVLTSRAVLGELCCKGHPPIVNYYPRLVSDAIWYQARAAATARRQQRGRSGKWVNLFVGLIQFNDGHNAFVRTSNYQDTNYRRLASQGHRDGVEGACPLSVDYGKVERSVMALPLPVEARRLAPNRQAICRHHQTP